VQAVCEGGTQQKHSCKRLLSKNFRRKTFSNPCQSGAASYKKLRMPRAQAAKEWFRAAKSLFTISAGPRRYLFGMGCKAQRAAHSRSMGKRCNAADRPKRYLPEGLGRNRAIWRPSRLHGQAARAARLDHQLIPIAAQRGPVEIANRL